MDDELSEYEAVKLFRPEDLPRDFPSLRRREQLPGRSNGPHRPTTLTEDESLMTVKSPTISLAEARTFTLIRSSLPGVLPVEGMGAAGHGFNGTKAAAGPYRCARQDLRRRPV